VALAASAGLRVLAVTDHDSIEGLGEAAEKGREVDVVVLPGVELSAYHREAVHVVGLFLDPASEWLADLAARRGGERRRRVFRICDQLASLGVDLDPEEVIGAAGKGSVGRPHVASALVRMGVVEDVDDAFGRFLGTGRPAFVPSSRLTVPQAIDAVHAAGGLAVLAHPGMYTGDLPIRDWAEHGLDALECAHPHHDERAEAALRALARDLGLVVSGGSDFHGVDSRRAELPGSHGITRAELDTLRRRHAELGV